MVPRQPSMHEALGEGGCELDAMLASEPDLLSTVLYGSVVAHSFQGWTRTQNGLQKLSSLAKITEMLNAIWAPHQ